MKRNIVEFYKSTLLNQLNESKSKIVQDVLNMHNSSNTSSAYSQTNTNPDTLKSDIPFKKSDQGANVPSGKTYNGGMRAHQRWQDSKRILGPKEQSRREAHQVEMMKYILKNRKTNNNIFGLNRKNSLI